MKMHLIAATVLGLGGAALMVNTPALANSSDSGSMSQNHDPSKTWMGSSGNGSSRDTGLQSHESGSQAQNYYKGGIGQGGNGSARNTGVQSHESTGSTSR